VATSGFVNCVPTVALCPPPLVAVIDAGAPAVFVRLKLAAAATPETVAITVYDPAVVFAVNAGEAATPLELVVAVAVFVAPVNVPLAPVAGAANVTTAPLTGLL